MAIIEWTEDKSVGVEVLDSHHQRLIGMLNDLYDVLRSRDSDAVVGRVIGELVDYTLYHFTEEERLMEAAKYPGLDAHRDIHRQLIAQVHEYRDEYHVNSRAVVAAELFEFLSDWLIHHIKHDDKAYGPSLTRKA